MDTQEGGKGGAALMRGVWVRGVRLLGGALGVALVLHGLVWWLDPRESILFVLWAGSRAWAAPLRALMATGVGAGLLLGLRRQRRAARLGAALVAPGVLWALVDAVMVWGAGLGPYAVDLDRWAWLPTSLVLALVLGAMAWLNLRCAANPEPWPQGWARRAVVGLGAVAVAAGLGFLLLLQHVLAMGATDYRREADTAVVFGARVYADGRPSPVLYDRVMTGVKLYKRGQVRRVVMTGAIDAGHGVSEPAVMKRVAVEAGVPDEAILLDETGVNTAASVRNLAAMMNEHRLGRLLMVSNDHHASRIQLACHRLSMRCRTVPAELRQIPRREPWYLVREVVGFLYYAAFFRAREDLSRR